MSIQVRVDDLQAGEEKRISKYLLVSTSIITGGSEMVDGHNTLYYGDNLDILRDHVQDESVDLVYLDPPFNSQRSYNLLFKEEDTGRSPAQIRAFEDTWHWTGEAEQVFHTLVTSAPARVSETVGALVAGVGKNDVTAYLVMMTIRLLELWRVLKPTGSVYLHCDPTMSHYLKVVMDQVFGPRNFRREIVWRSGWVSGFKAGARNWARNHDIILYYTKSNRFTFNKTEAYVPHPPGYKRRGGGENPRGVALDDVWTDIYSPWIMSFSREKLGFMTQKPLSLLERIVAVSSNEGELVLDPFCGCGTAIVAAEKLRRRWIGVDITHQAIAVVKQRLSDHFPGLSYRVIGEPVDLPGARALAAQNAYQFQWWAIGLVGARPLGEKKKGADEGIDGVIPFVDEPSGKVKRVVVQVKGGHSSVSHVRELSGKLSQPPNILGILIVLQPPSRQMVSEAAKTGFYHSPVWNRDYPRMQVCTVEDLQNGIKPNLPPPVPPPVARNLRKGQRGRINTDEGEQPNMF